MKTPPSLGDYIETNTEMSTYSHLVWKVIPIMHTLLTIEKKDLSTALFYQKRRFCRTDGDTRPPRQP